MNEHEYLSQSAMDTQDTYWLGYRHGRRVAEHEPAHDYEHALRLELRLIGTTNRAHRAFALGELRGYRQATGRPEPLMGHKVLS